MDADDTQTRISQFPDDVLPPEGIYESRAALFTAANAWAKPRGYVFTTGKSTKTPSGRTKVTVSCDRTRQPPNPSVLAPVPYMPSDTPYTPLMSVHALVPLVPFCPVCPLCPSVP
jgi:hypothetical protein